MVRRAILAFLVTFAVYLPSARFSLVRCDDPDYIVANGHLRGGLTVENVRWAFCDGIQADNWHPFTWLSLMADVSVDLVRRGGRPHQDGEWKRLDSPLAHVMHVHNVALHAANAVLLFALILVACRRQLGADWALALALLWALHPLRVEAVCWVTERKELLSAFFGLLSALFWFQGSSRTGYFLSLAAFALGLLSKSVVVTLPVVLLAWDWIFGGRIRVLRLVPFAALSLGACAMTVKAQAVALASGGALPLSARLATTLCGPVVYLRQTFWPFGLSACYPATWRVDVVPLASGVGLLVAMAWTCVRWLRRRERLAGLAAFAVAWTYVGLLPMLGIVKAGGDEHCDRFTYWIGCGAAVCAALFLRELASRREWLWTRLGGAWAKTPWLQVRRGLLCGAACAVVLLGGVTWARIPYWRDSATLFRDAVAKSWIIDWAEVLALGLQEDYGEAGAKEGERWLRACAVRQPSRAADLALASFLLSRPRSSGWDGSMDFAEEETLLRGVLAAEPDNAKAKRLLEKIDGMKRTD